MKFPIVAASAALSIGIAFSGWFIGGGVSDASKIERFVSVKGLAEKQVMADRAVWAISYVSASNNLAEAREALKKSQTAGFAFLDKYNIERSDIELQNLRILDQLARTYNTRDVALRYLLQQTILVRTNNINAVAQASQNVGELLDAGVLLGNIEGYNGNDGPQYIFTQLNDIKPDMIAEATANARLAAQKFAKDAGADIEGIRRAVQGRFEILPAENALGLSEANQIHKKVRVVTTLDYVLES
ncbi:SIMPL domain-containing protein [Kordiimonas aquimaris]|uniref:SIMPL domain-containing protein n=1 Tax=Kordiimonas aquimaris TaxID=707591 RepID=UPI0021CE5261|nr:SIMPL domain-containing protein [Kordiimonas aquimaris]